MPSPKRQKHHHSAASEGEHPVQHPQPAVDGALAAAAAGAPMPVGTGWHSPLLWTAEDADADDAAQGFVLAAAGRVHAVGGVSDARPRRFSSLVPDGGPPVPTPGLWRLPPWSALTPGQAVAQTELDATLARLHGACAALRETDPFPPPREASPAHTAIHRGVLAFNAPLFCVATDCSETRARTPTHSGSVPWRCGRSSATCGCGCGGGGRGGRGSRGCSSSWRRRRCTTRGCSVCAARHVARATGRWRNTAPGRRCAGRPVAAANDAAAAWGLVHALPACG